MTLMFSRVGITLGTVVRVLHILKMKRILEALMIFVNAVQDSIKGVFLKQYKIH